jgi:hypothetical protein
MAGTLTMIATRLYIDHLRSTKRTGSNTGNHRCPVSRAGIPGANELSVCHRNISSTV